MSTASAGQQCVREMKHQSKGICEPLSTAASSALTFQLVAAWCSCTHAGLNSRSLCISSPIPKVACSACACAAAVGHVYHVSGAAMCKGGAAAVNKHPRHTPSGTLLTALTFSMAFACYSSTPSGLGSRSLSAGSLIPSRIPRDGCGECTWGTCTASEGSNAVQPG